MNQHTHLRHADVATMMRLVRELQEANDSNARQRHLLQSLRGLTGASGALLGAGRIDSGNARLTGVSLLYDGLTAEQFEVLDGAARRGEPANPVEAPLVGLLSAQAPALVVVRRGDLIDDGAWYASAFAQQVHQRAEVDDALFAIERPGAGPEYVAVILYKPWGAAAGAAGRFTAREVQLLEILHTHTTWVRSPRNGPAVPQPASGGASPELESLPPRLVNTLKHLLTGASEKEVATRTGLTRNTVHEYVKLIYQHFGVSSRAELLAKLLRRQ